MTPRKDSYHKVDLLFFIIFLLLFVIILVSYKLSSLLRAKG